MRLVKENVFESLILSKTQTGLCSYKISAETDCSGNHKRNHLSRIMRKMDFAYAKTKAQTSFAITAKLISAFVFATRIVQSLFFLNPKFQVSRLFLCLYRMVCVEPGQNPKLLVFSRTGSYIFSRHMFSM